MKSNRIVALDILKFVATLAIFNHMAARFYGSAPYLATGGVVGCALFFFCSGYALALGKMGRFDVWYKRRLMRILPTSFTAALVYGLTLGGGGDVIYALQGSGWFVTCILVHYLAYYILDMVFRHNTKHIFLFAVTVSIVSFVFWQPGDRDAYWILGGYSKWVQYFILFAFGALMGKTRDNGVRLGPTANVVGLLVSFVLVYACYFSLLGSFWMPRFGFLAKAQWIMLLPIVGMAYFAFCIADCEAFGRLVEGRSLYRIVVFIGGLSLEMFLIGRVTTKLLPAWRWPLGWISALLATIVCSYLARAFGRLLAQTFDRATDGYDLRAAFR